LKKGFIEVRLRNAFFLTKTIGWDESRKQKKEGIMKKVVVLAVLAIAVIGIAGSAFALTTANANVQINATVGTNCTAISANNLTLPIDVAAGVGGTESDSIGNNTTVQCVNGTAVAVTASSVNNGGAPSATGQLAGLLKAPGHTDIPYTLYFANSLTGLGLGGAAYDMTIVTGNGSAAMTTGAVVAAAAAAAAQAGAYTDQVTVTISY
jgi:spore coat protein U-like protein